MLDASLPSLTALRGLGVRRVSLGPRLAEVAYCAAKRALRELLADRSYGSLVAGGLTYAEANGLFSVSSERF
jgi:2-methylisocitrate lyase-like PEP mutase family enzyme